MIQLEQLCSLYGRRAVHLAPWMAPLQAAFVVADISNRLRLAMFLAQVGHESGGLRYVREIWGPTAQQERYEPVTSLSKRLGNHQAGDGKCYMGRGPIQTTGRANYRELQRLMAKVIPHAPDFEANPAELEKPLYGALSAALFWKTRNLNRYADAGDVSGCTKRINGGYNGLAHRQALYTKALILC